MDRKDPLIYCIGIVVMLACLSISLAACNLPHFGGQPSAKKPTPTSTIGHDLTPTSTISNGLTPTSTSGHGSTPIATTSNSLTPIATSGHGSTPIATSGHGSTPIATSGHDSTATSTTSNGSTPIATSGHGSTPISITSNGLTPISIIGSTPISTTVSSSAKSCGTLRYQQVGNNTGPILAESNKYVLKVVNCFLQAFKHCAPASIEMNVSIGAARINPFSVSNVHMFNTKLPTDGGIANLYQFTISSQSGRCVVSEVEQAYSVVAPIPPTPRTCAQVKQTRADLRFVNCGNAGTITFPLAKTIP